MLLVILKKLKLTSEDIMEAAIMASAIFISHAIHFHTTNVNVNHWTHVTRPYIGFALMGLALGKMFNIF